MGSLFRSTIVSLAAASFAALALVGDGLHVMPGFQHAFVVQHACCVGPAGCLPTPVADACCYAGRGHSAALDGCAADQPDAPQEPACPPQEHTCPVCRLLAQAKSPAAAVELPPPGAPVLQRANVSSPLCFLSPDRAFDARGPPLGVCAHRLPACPHRRGISFPLVTPVG